jgi:preprotein translocase subunit SecB
MTDTPTPDIVQLPPAPFRLIAQYLKDLSFENPGAVQVLTIPQREVPRGQLKFDVQARVVAPMKYEISLVLGITALRDQETVYIVELEYAGLFDLTGAPEEHISPLLMIEAPRLLFPFAREILANATNAGGYPPVMLNPIDFVAVYRERMARAAAGTQPAPVVPQA